jgi:hypothetical protein
MNVGSPDLKPYYYYDNVFLKELSIHYMTIEEVL